MTTPEIVLGVVMLLVLLPVVAAVVYRLVVIRGDSTSVLVRRVGEDSWHHGAIRYSDTEVAFYRLLSVRFGADVRLERRTLALGPRRQPTGHELDVAEVGELIVSYSGHDRRGELREGELCAGHSELTGLLSWVEACSTDQIRRDSRRRR